MRITRNTLAGILNKELIELNLPYELTANDIAPTRYTHDQYAEGASKLRIMAHHTQINDSHPLPVFSTYTMYELTKLLKNPSKKLVLRQQDFTHLDDLWIEVE